MSARFISAVLLCAAAGLAACAPTSSGDAAHSGQSAQSAAAGARACVFQRDIRNFRVSSDERNIYVRGPGQTIYRLEVAGACPELDHPLAIGFAPRGGINNLCTGDMTRLVFGRSASAIPCDVRMAGALSAAEVAALPERERP
ncbi:DUF6491 family protein [Brevundimonas guildfordensis]|uniref:Lipoprotein n=1 Tax=Brevundimonas guildfordensis TaxID=2762241 RepID=A0ABR8R0E8_9CAUL|nr:DUF6491 family protein [Brevundimonas guildfordensis]MBD7941276.1 hypothetical protein [Brevundimonas guildfordensis]